MISKPRYYYLLLGIITSLFSVSTASDSLFVSPTGKFSVQFKQLKHTKYAHPKNIDEFSNIQYRIIFLDLKTGKSYNAEYYDVYVSYVSNKNKPTPLRNIFEQITWSPIDQFAILPEEAWASAPGAPTRVVINLDLSNKWSTSFIIMDNLVWFDNLIVCGTQYDDCYYCALLFDGKKGKTFVLKKAKSPVGYEVVGLRQDSLIIRSLLDNCSGGDDKEKFRSVEIAFTRKDINKIMHKEPPNQALKLTK
ncbi:MAG: hypothetical protein ABR936_15520 [Bacteroidota bacterium]